MKVACDFWVFLLLVSLSCLAAAEEDFIYNKKKYVVEEVEGVETEAVRLPCNMSVETGDTVYLVLWFKEGLTTPIYSYDVRELLAGQPKHWWDADLLGSRAFFNGGSTPSHLLLQSLKKEDAGVYKCRVDFQRAPTRNTRVNLTVVVPPRRLVLVEESGAEVRSYVGPVNEGDDLHLSCQAHGGEPRPSVVWLLDDKQVDDAVESSEGDVTRNDLTLSGVTRSLLRAQLTCRASNNKVSNAMSITATLDMNLRPLDVTINHPREPLSAGRTYEVLCSSRGSRPPAVLTWWWGSVRVSAADDMSSHGGNMTTSMVRIRPNASDDGRLLACRAENRNVPTAVIEDTWKLSVYYAPKAEAVLGASLNPQNIREGDDVYFECRVQANPRAYKVVWKHNGMLVRHDKDNGVLLTNRSLVVQEVTRNQAGSYTCMASNVEGDSASPPVILSVQYAPVCRPGQVSVYGVSKLEDAHVTCEVDAVPQVSRFYWNFNNTFESLEVPQERFTVGLGGRSVVIFTPTSDHEYGTLFCSSENMVGRQAEPCVFHIIPATKPEAPTKCSVFNVSASSLTVSCTPGFDGGLNQTFAMEVYGTNPHTLKANITADVPKFVVTGLDNESEFQLIVYAGNAKGRSGITRLMTHTQKLPVKQLETRVESSSGPEEPDSNPLAMEITPLFGVLVGVVLVLVLVAIVIVIILKVQCNVAARRRQARQGDDVDSEQRRGATKTGSQKQKRHKQQQHQQQHQQEQQQQQQQQSIGKSREGSEGDGSEKVLECYTTDPHLHHHHHQGDHSPDVVACSGDCDDVNVSVKTGSAMSLIRDHRHDHHQHLQQQQRGASQDSPTFPQHTQQCPQHLHQQMHSPPLQQHSQQSQHSPQALMQHGQDLHHYSLPLSGPHHDFRHTHLMRDPVPYPTTPRMCGSADIEVHYGDRSGGSGTPPDPAPPDLPVVPLSYVGSGAGTGVGGRVPGLARIPEDPESPTPGGRRESAV